MSGRTKWKFVILTSIMISFICCVFDEKSVHGCKIQDNLWVWLIGPGMWIDERDFFGPGEFILFCEHKNEDVFNDVIIAL